MNLIFIYGPPAVGKLTTAIKLSEKLNYKIFHNHLVIDLVKSVYEQFTNEFNLYFNQDGRPTADPPTGQAGAGTPGLGGPSSPLPRSATSTSAFDRFCTLWGNSAAATIAVL